MFENSYVAQRIKKAQDLRERHINPYDNTLTRTKTNQSFLDTYAYLLQEDNEASTDSRQTPQSVESIVGRIRFIRLMGKACFVKIQDGCDNRCSYCIIPFARGKSRSARVCYVDFPDVGTVYLITIYEKKEKDNLTAAERSSIRKMIQILEQLLTGQ